MSSGEWEPCGSMASYPDVELERVELFRGQQRAAAIVISVQRAIDPTDRWAVAQIVRERNGVTRGHTNIPLPQLDGVIEALVKARAMLMERR